MSPVGVFVSFDVEHDEELFEILVAQAGTAGFDFEVLGGSTRSAGTGLADAGVRRQIRDAGQMIVLCGEHSEVSFGMAEELRVAREEETPYILLWGRRAVMCTKPIGAKPAEGMFSWTQEILQDQIGLSLRNALADAEARRAAASKE
jgi:hypothetical protein